MHKSVSKSLMRRLLQNYENRNMDDTVQRAFCTSMKAAI